LYFLWSNLDKIWFCSADHCVLNDYICCHNPNVAKNNDIKKALTKQGFNKIFPGPVAFELRKKAIEDYLTKTYAEGPGMLIDEGNCPLIVEGMAGGYRYPDKANEIEPHMIRPIKNKYSHPLDALQYLASGANHLRKSYGIDLPTPSYGFAE